jgi:NADH:ubiquinone oxidoreductase subunit 4 (subunit M)
MIALLSLILFLPALGALVLLAFPKEKVDAIRMFSLAVTAVVLLLTAWLAVQGHDHSFRTGVAEMQGAFSIPWISTFNIYYALGTDGVSFPLVALTALIFVLAMWASWPITQQVKGYCILFLLLETGVLGVFLALDFFLFYVFWEVMLLPMYFLIGIWGGPRREYAAIKFFLFTLVGGVAMLVAVLMLYFHSDLRVLAAVSDFDVTNDNPQVAWSQLHLHPEVESLLGRGATQWDPQRDEARVVFYRLAGKTTEVSTTGAVVASVAPPTRSAAWSKPLEIQFVRDADAAQGDVQSDETADRIVLRVRSAAPLTAAQVVQVINADPYASQVVHAALPRGSRGSGEVQATDSVTLAPFDPSVPLHTFNILALAKMGQFTALFDSTIWGMTVQWWAFLLLFIGFAIKVPVVPVHTWLPDAHVEAPTPISMILAGILLKLGGYGILRICYPICPQAAYDLAWLVCLIGVVSMVYGAFAAMAQKDFKRLVAYSSVSHMGYVILGMGVWTATAEHLFATDSWKLGMNGAMFQMIAHGISSSGMFFLVGVVYDRVHHRNLDEFGGLFAKMPVYSGISIAIFFAAMGLPGLCGFIGEVFVTLSAWNFSRVLAVISAATVILTAGYILWTVQRVYFGPEYKGPHPEALTPMTTREVLIGAPLVALAIILGVFPQTVFNYMSPSVNQTVDDLRQWSIRLGVSVPENAATATSLSTASSRPAAATLTTSRAADAANIVSGRRDETLSATAIGPTSRRDVPPEAEGLWTASESAARRLAGPASVAPGD